MARNIKFQEQYDKIIQLHPELLDIDSDKERAKQIVILSDDVMSTICKEADKIKIDAFQTVENQWKHLGIPLPVWLELVNLRRLKRHANLPDKVMDRIAGSYIGAKNVTAFREQAILAVTNGAYESKVPSIETEKALTYEPDETLNQEFFELLDECADVRHTLDSKHWPSLRLYGEAYNYLTNEPWGIFKMHLDFYHYRKGGWPSEKTPPRAYSRVKGFANALRAEANSNFNELQQWAKRFGLKIELTHPSPTIHHFSDDGAKFGQFFMFKFKDDRLQKYASLGVEPYHHMIQSNGLTFAYVWDTREIEVVFESSKFLADDIHTDYVDNCWPLRLSDKLSETDKVNAQSRLAILLQDQNS